MHHAMLYQRKVCFNSGVHHFCDVMCLQQGKVILDADFNINVDTAAEKTAVQTVEMLYTGNAETSSSIAVVVSSSQLRSTILSIESLNTS